MRLKPACAKVGFDILVEMYIVIVDIECCYNKGWKGFGDVVGKGDMKNSGELKVKRKWFPIIFLNGWPKF